MVVRGVKGVFATVWPHQLSIYWFDIASSIFDFLLCVCQFPPPSTTLRFPSYASLIIHVASAKVPLAKVSPYSILGVKYLMPWTLDKYFKTHAIPEG